MGLETRVHLSRWAVLECLGRKCGGFASLNICLPSLPGHVMPVTVYPHLVAWTRIDQAPPRTMGIDILFIPQFQRAAPHFKFSFRHNLRRIIVEFVKFVGPHPVKFGWPHREFHGA